MPDLGWTGQWLDARTLQLFHKKPLPKAAELLYTPKPQTQSLSGVPVIRLKRYAPYPFSIRSAPELVRYEADGTLHY